MTHTGVGGEGGKGGRGVMSGYLKCSHDCYISFQVSLRLLTLLLVTS